MKKLTCLLVMLLLGSGLTKAFVWDDVNGYPSFTFWNISGQYERDLVNLERNQNYKMYIYFTTKYDITTLRFDLKMLIGGTPVPFISNVDCATGCGVTLPKRVGDYIEFKFDFALPHAFEEFPDSLRFVLEATFTNQDGRCVAAGRVPARIKEKTDNFYL